ncbi:putative FmdB family regulatory protein [Kineosphaera limosa]|uniref:Putative regulatory protein n=1 Tax=Kineosphaera limosa NBRC 100340 TaxID=1184609 RepID=K6WMF0_9MICO|nr:zinc ribbon domain-containing protein [Kineosphaera limosa]NYE00558.1 putative FmdB family regulatory protein [Kineosphaera limosa]GAB94976.1 putative regulatory protein [Kineosphaera limosa NBRC 100340]
MALRPGRLALVMTAQQRRNGPVPSSVAGWQHLQFAAHLRRFDSGVLDVPTYAYRCPECGDFDRLHPMHEVPDRQICPGCSTPASRRWTAVGLGHGASPAMRALDSAARSASEPSVVSAPPPGERGRPISRDPRHAKLPRP